MRTILRTCGAIFGFAVLASALGGCNDDSSNGNGSAASSSPDAVGSSGQSTPPVIAGNPSVTAIAGRRYEFRPIVQAADGAELVFSIANQPAWASFDPTTGDLAGTPAPTDARKYANISITVSSSGMSAKLQPFSIQVVAPPAPQSASMGLQIMGTPANKATAGAAYSFQPRVAGADDETATYTVQNLPSWAQFDASTGKLSGTPDGSDAGMYQQIIITVAAGGDTASLPAFSIDVASGSSTVATVTWAAPSGSGANDVSGYRVYYGTSAAGMTHYVSVKDPTATSYVIDNLSSGTWYFAIASYDAKQAQSPLSPIVEVSL